MTTFKNVSFSHDNFAEDLYVFVSSSQLVQDTANNVINFTGTLLAEQTSLEHEFENSRSNIVDGQEICNSTDPLASQINQIADELSTHIKDFGTRLRDEVSSFGDDMRELVALTQNVDDKLDEADIIFYVLIAISVIIVVIILAMLAGSFFAAKGVSNCFTKFVTNVILWPIFIFFLFLMWAFSTLFLVVSIAGADFCIRPDYYVEEILTNYKDEFSSIIFGFLIYYISVSASCFCYQTANHIYSLLISSLYRYLRAALLYRLARQKSKTQ